MPSAFQVYIADLDYRFYLSYYIVYICQVDAVRLYMTGLECCDLSETFADQDLTRLILYYLQE